MTEEHKKSLFEDIDQYKDGIYVLRHEMEEKVPKHKHRQGHILVVLNGVATMNVEHSEYYIPNGYFVWIPAGTVHRITFEGKAIKHLNVYFPADMEMMDFYAQVGIYPIPSILYHIIDLVKQQTAFYQADDWKYELLMTLNHILPHILNENRFQLRLPMTDHPVLQKIIHLIQAQYQSPISAQSIAEEAGMSTRSLSRYMKSELGISFVQYVRTFRIIMAIKQMVKGEETLTNIAYNVGFDSITSFSNSFYKVTGCRPSLF